MNWEKIYSEAQTIFRDLLRIDTTNPPGNELTAAKYVKDVLNREGLEVTLLESAPDRANVVTRLSGDGSKRPLLLHGHLDVVHAEPDKWSMPPFSAEIKDGFIWGRGAVDMKNFVSQSMIVMALLKREGVKLKRDLIFAAVADEENGMRAGSVWLTQNHPELVRAEYAIGEGGGFQMHLAGQVVFPVMIAEKGVCWLRLRATGTPGHGSVPHGDNALVKLAEAAAALGNKRLPLHVTPATRQMIQAMAQAQPAIKGLVLKQVLNPVLSDLIIDKVLPDKSQAAGIAALLHNTVSPTVFRAGDKTNVIPSEATLELDGRILPGQTKESFIDEIKQVIGDGFEIEIINEAAPVEVPFDDPFVDTVREVMKTAAPEAIVIPFLMPGYTDAKNFNSLGAITYGFAPLLLPEDLPYSTLAHGHNERISIEGFNFGVKTLYELVRRFCS